MPQALLRGFYAILDLSPPAEGWHAYLPPLDAPGPAPDPWPDAEQKAAQLLAARPSCLQVRAKDAPARCLQDVSVRIATLCRALGIPFCVNDRVDVAMVVGADYGHVGQEDLPLAAARRAVELGIRVPGAPSLGLGVSTHNLAQARAAFEGGADYIGFGPVFPTGTKKNPDPVVGVEALAAVVRAVEIPVVAIGGIGLDNVAAVVRAGAHAAAVISAVARAEDVTAAAKRVAAAFSNTSF